MKRVISLILTLLMIIVSVPVIHADSITLADVNGDGKINMKDVLILRKHIAGLSSGIVISAADVNADGDVDFKDLLLLRRHIAGIVTIDRLPVTDSYIAEAFISGVNIRNYTIVVPAESDLFTVYAAELLQDYIDDKSGITLPIVTDETSETEYEFLIGVTNREESVAAASAVELEPDEYLLKQDGGKIVMLGDSYMIGGGVGKFTYDYMTYDPALTSQRCAIDSLPTENVATPYEARGAKNVIFMIGDGMGPLHPKLTVEFNARRPLEADYTEFYADRLPVLAKVQTYSLTTLESDGETPTDSAAGGTALACGVKTYNHYVGIDGEKNVCQNLRELAASLGKRNAVMSTESMVGATPATFTVHLNERSNTTAINILQQNISDATYLKGDIGDELLSETKYALDLLSTNNEEGFFAMIEEAYIDKECHGRNNGWDQAKLVHYMARLNNAMQYAMVFATAHPDTLLLLTADHETGGLKYPLQRTTDKHTGVDVNIYAIGSGSEHFTGTINNTDIPKIIAAEWGAEDFGE